MSSSTKAVPAFILDVLLLDVSSIAPTSDQRTSACLLVGRYPATLPMAKFGAIPKAMTLKNKATPPYEVTCKFLTVLHARSVFLVHRWGW